MFQKSGHFEEPIRWGGGQPQFFFTSNPLIADSWPPLPLQEQELSLLQGIHDLCLVVNFQ